MEEHNLLDNFFPRILCTKSVLVAQQLLVVVPSCIFTRFLSTKSSETQFTSSTPIDSAIHQSFPQRSCITQFTSSTTNNSLPQRQRFFYRLREIHFLNANDLLLPPFTRNSLPQRQRPTTPCACSRPPRARRDSRPPKPKTYPCPFQHQHHAH